MDKPFYRLTKEKENAITNIKNEKEIITKIKPTNLKKT